MVKYRNKIYKHEWQAVAVACIQIVGGTIVLGGWIFCTMFLLLMIG